MFDQPFGSNQGDPSIIEFSMLVQENYECQDRPSDQQKNTIIVFRSTTLQIEIILFKKFQVFWSVFSSFSLPVLSKYS